MDGMLRSMTWQQFLGWQEYAALEPFGDERADFRAGVIAAAIYNNNPNRTKDSKIFKPGDFFHFAGDKSSSSFARRERQPMDDEGWSRFKAELIALGKSMDKDKRRN